MINSIQNDVSFGHKSRSHNDKKHKVDRLILPVGFALAGASIGVAKSKEITPLHISFINPKRLDKLKAFFEIHADKFTKKDKEALKSIYGEISWRDARIGHVADKVNKTFPKGVKKVPIETILGMSVDQFKQKNKETKIIAKALRAQLKANPTEELKSLYEKHLAELASNKTKFTMLKFVDKKGNISKRMYTGILYDVSIDSIKQATKTLKGKLPKVPTLGKMAVFAGIGIIAGNILNKLFGFSK